MSGKYEALQEHLFSRDDAVWNATFGEIEEVIGDDLPKSARKHQAWWANQSHGHSQYWQRAGWLTANVDVENECLTFNRFDDRRHLVGGSVTPEKGNDAPLTIAEAKAGLAVQFGIDPSQIEIIIKG